MNPADNAPPLDGIRILDLTRLLPGALATLHLADLGADVIKIEDTKAGDYMRVLDLPPHQGTSKVYAATCRNKRSLAIDLKSPAGRKAFLRLADSAQVLIESFRPTTAERLGIGYGTLRKSNPGLVYCAISGYGATGPWRDRAGHDLNYSSLAGIAARSGAGECQGDPALPNLPISDIVGGSLSAVMAVLAALFATARKGGKGRYLDVSMTDCALAHNVFAFQRQDQGGGDHPDLFLGETPAYRHYRAADGIWFGVAAIEDKFWHGFCQTLDLPELIARQDSQEWLDRAHATIERRFAEFDSCHWRPLFERADCCVEPVEGLENIRSHPQISARELIVEYRHADAGLVRQFGFPVKMSDYRFSLRRPAPRQGEHSVEVLRDCGLDDKEIGTLATQGVIRTSPAQG